MARWHSSGAVSSQTEAVTWPADGEHWAAQAMDDRGDRRGRAALHGETRSGQRSSSSLQDRQWRPADNELNRRWLSESRENGVAESWGTSALDRFAL
jgi:hypothetical protein